MSLVAYDASTDDESDTEDEHPTTLNSRPTAIISSAQSSTSTISSKKEDEISDEEDFQFNEDQSIDAISQNSSNFNKLHLNLPVPKSNILYTETEASKTFVLKLPTPKTSISKKNEIIEEQDDEFLHKKAIQTSIEKPPPPPKGPVKITIPALSQFRNCDVKKDRTTTNTKTSCLLDLLPQPKHENSASSKSSNFTTTKESNKPKTSTTSLIPDAVKNRKPTASISARKPIGLKNLVCSDSEGSENEDDGDFFSLNREVKLPEVSVNEINAMVQKKATKMAKASLKLESMIRSKDEEQKSNEDMNEETDNENKAVHVEQEAIQALIGSRQAKRRKVADEVQVVDLSSSQVLPNRNEWMRTALASETGYQVRGVLVDEEPAPGTRKKHQITYLAHQAKANEAELQAMWATNRQNRRATASKYGF